ncbi:hypothetical protein [Hymenobacter jeollabukensis]|uniref:Uncharacterized protein n=1 Tax=Hymenobacter jeollabukensis TaxID=2025313 RepID=A0A5R8WVK8_9BACT|nr:hypothetical protein [Hymenobacter jeollabukensis]TLM96547.1 hypothetical protein FDY95_00690 [Hymenobacter jeollabukensis]
MNPLLRIVLLAGGLAAATATRGQNRPAIVVNGAPFQDCQLLRELRTLALPVGRPDTLMVEFIVVRGYRPIGVRQFPSVAAFNEFDVLSWLNTPGVAPPSAAQVPRRYELPMRSKVQGGDQLVVTVGRLAKGRRIMDDRQLIDQTYHILLCDEQ